MTTPARFSVVHTNAAFATDWTPERAALAAIGASFSAVSPGTEDELIAVAAAADALIVVREPVTRRVIAALKRAKVIVRSGVGYDVIDVPAATEHDIAVCSIPDYCTEEVANHALALLLAANRRVVSLDALVRGGGWRRGDLGAVGALTGETAGVIGYGRIGRAMAARCRALGMRVVFADPYVTDGESGDRRVSLDELLTVADYVTIHTPLTEETRGLIGERTLSLMKPSAIVINTSRGGVVDQPALARALKDGRIAGAGLDVLADEPPTPGDPLLHAPNTVLTPHTAYYSTASAARLRDRVIDEVVHVLSGRRPPGLLNPSVWRD